jgi:Kef-type K+ transport system membrane component KefB
MTRETQAKALRRWLVYLGMVVAAVGLFFAVCSVGEGLSAPTASGAVGAAIQAKNAVPKTLVHVLLALLTIIVASRALGSVFRLLRQPAVVGEVLAGICLGPSLLGRVAPQAQALLLPADVAPYLGMLSQVGVILFMFLVGLELDTGLLRRRSHATLAISHASMLAPFCLGALAALWLYPAFSNSQVPFTVFAMFVGVAVSVTAFPVLARILTDTGMHRSQLGVVALTCAAVDDVTAWCLLALVVGVAQAEVAGALQTCLLSLAYIVFMLAVIRPLVAKRVALREHHDEVSQTGLALVIVALLASTLTTELIGIHAVFGAFLLGAVIPHSSRLATELQHKLEDLVVVLFLPAFFAFTGLRTQIGLVSGIDQWLACLGVIGVACLGKFGGSYVAARCTGMPTRDAAAIGVLMNTRGLMELIVLNIGLDLGVISPTLFAMMVIMALVTTFATTPLLRFILRGDPTFAFSRLRRVIVNPTHPSAG